MHLEIADDNGEPQFGVVVGASGSVALKGWAAWANEELDRADTTSIALRLFSSEVRGLSGVELPVREEGDDEDETIRRLCQGMRRKGAEARRVLLPGG